MSGFALSRYVSGNTILEEQELPLADAADQVVGPAYTVTPPPADPQNPGVATEQQADVATALGQGALAAAVGTETQTLGFGPLRSGVANCRAQYDELVAVQSASLPNGTPVTVRMRYRVAFGAAQAHDLAPAQLSGSNTNYARMDFQLETQLGPNPAVAHRWYESADGFSDVNGIFANPADAQELTTAAAVGQALRVRADLRCYASSSASPYAGTFPAAQTGGTAAVVFGVEADEAGVTLVSTLLGGALPGLANASAANALAHALPIAVGIPVTVPEPAGTWQGFAAAGVLVALRARYAARHERA